MKTRHVWFILVAVVMITTLLACSITQISTNKTNSQPATPTAGSSEEGQKPTDASAEEHPTPTATSTPENLEPIVGTWKQIPFQGIQGRSNVGLAGYAWFGDYFYAGTFNVFSPPVPQPQTSTGGAVPPPGAPGPSAGQPSAGAAQSPEEAHGAEIWRTLDGTNWEVIGEPGLGNPEFVSFRPVFFQERVYVFAETKSSLLVSKNGKTFELVNGEWSDGDIKYGLQNYIIEDALLVSGVSSQKGLQAWLSTDGKAFDAVITDGLGELTNKQLCGYTSASLDGWYYLGVRNDVNGGQLWRTQNGRTWEQSLKAGYDDPRNVSLCNLLIHNGHLYMSIPGYYGHDPDRGMEIIRTADGETWEKVIENGFGLGEAQGYSGWAKVYKDTIYLMLTNFPPQSGGPASTGFRLLRSLDGKTWEQVGKPGFGYPNSISATSHVIRGLLYIVTHNLKDGNQIWRSSDGTSWELFHTFPASETNYGHALAELADGIEYFEYDMGRGVQIWRYGP
jgi:hypothetical protein